MVSEGTFGSGVLTTEDGASVPGYQVMACAIYNNNLIISYSRYDGNTTANNIPTHFSTFSLANPLAPVQVGSTVDIQRGDSNGLYVAGNTALMYQSTSYYDQYDGFIYQETGDVWAADLTNAGTTGAIAYLNDIYPCGTYNTSNDTCSNVTNVPAATSTGGVCTPNGTTAIPNVQNQGGPYPIGYGTAVNSNTTYFASTSAYGGNIENPSCPQISGQMLVINTSTPSVPAIQASIADPAMAIMTGVAIQGNIAVAVGDSTGTYSINSGYVGTLVISSFDISGTIAAGSSPANPVLLDSVTTQLADSAGSFIVPLGSNTFAVGNTTLNKNAELVLVDASNPSALRYIPYNALFVANPTVAQNGYFFALSSTPASSTNSISAFQLSQVTGPQLTVKLNLPNSGNAMVDPTSFSLAPTSVTTGTSYNTYVWVQPAPNTITFNVDLTGVNPGDVDTVVVSGEMDYTLPSLGSGTFVLPPVTVLSQQILTISPTVQAVNNAGNSATYTVTVANPTSSQQTFVPYTVGIPASWGVQLPASVTVAPGASQNFNLVLTTPLNVSVATYTFFTAVTTAGGITGSVGASLAVYSGANSNGGNPTAGYQSFTASLNPSSITIGQYGSASYQISITNTGTAANYIQANTYSPSFQNSPSTYSGWSLNYNPTTFPYILSGIENTVTVTGTLTLPPASYNSTTPGTYQLILPVTEGYITQNLTLTVNIVGAGVTAQLNPGNGTPTTTFTLYLTNQGSSADTYNLSVQGALAQVVSVPATSGTVAAGRQITVPVTFNTVDFVSPSSYTLVIKAVSQANPAIVSYAQGTIAVSGTKGVSAAITPSPTSVQSTPGSVSLLFEANNTGNVQDTYTASIISTTGPVSASLNGGQSIALFPIPVLGNAEFPLNAEVTGAGTATVTVKVTSLTNSSISSQATVTINNSSPPAPTAIAMPIQANTPVHRLAVLNASASYDPSNLPLTYLWTVVSTPPGSAVNNGSISLPTSVLAAVRPDVLGAYTFNVNVSNGTASANSIASYTAIDEPPVAVTGSNFNTAVSSGGAGAAASFTFLNGNNSYDPDGQPLTFAWSLVSAPNGSAVTSQSIYNSQTRNAFFIPMWPAPTNSNSSSPTRAHPACRRLITVTAANDGSIPPNADAGLARISRSIPPRRSTAATAWTPILATRAPFISGPSAPFPSAAPPPSVTPPAPRHSSLPTCPAHIT